MAPSAQSTPDGTTIDNNCSSEKYADVNWDELGFSMTETDFMYVMKCSIGENFDEGSIIPYGNIQLSPCSTLVNYGQGLFEGLKAYRKEDGKIQLFRPDQNALRMKAGAERLCMPSPSIGKFVDAVKQTVLANKRWVPPMGKGSLYVRPLLMGMGAALGLGPSPEYMFLVFASPVGDYYNKGRKPMNLLVEDKHRRASPGGTGGIKTVANYSPVLSAQARAKAQGFSDVLFLDAAMGKYVEEVSACNIFAVKGDVISTPQITCGTILPGITRKSIIEIALALGYKVEERLVPVEELLDADEVFCTGTAVVVTPVGSVTHQGKRVEYKEQGETVCHKLYETLTGIQTGRIEDKMGWMVDVI
ncbi:branched-chain amino acid aminotransferase 2, chloroplastic-like [Punica granatum]|uniref:Branched-chain-amino-acid aminotransferase n=2 Tax=Punica granatum TaxID=22663 RepID=A0A6P8CFU5_PUNGR|nr:branched-chain amino acid aminotransferase 2, chloroplastic-like [Punica granatum]